MDNVSTKKHTPGPWTLTHKFGRNFAVQEFDLRGMFGNAPNVYPIFNKDAFAINGTTVCMSPEDARLIAAAPELLEALRILHDETAEYVRLNKLGDPWHNRSMQLARSALAKAEGQS